MTSVESAEENQIVKLQMGDGDSAISQESNLDIEMIRDPAAVQRKGQQKTNMTGTKETQEMESYQVEEDGKTITNNLGTIATTNLENQSWVVHALGDQYFLGQLFELE